MDPLPYAMCFITSVIFFITKILRGRCIAHFVNAETNIRGR